MRLLELHLKAFGPFTDQILPLGSGTQRLVLVHGMNEAGKSSALRAISALRFGIPQKTTDRFLHDYQQMRVGGVFIDTQGNQYSLMRRKGTGVTLKFADFTNGSVELADPVPLTVSSLLTAGLSVEDYESMFGLDHKVLRAGGSALARGEGEIGAALFEASSGVGDVSKILGELDTTARKFFMPAANAKSGLINGALSAYKGHSDQHKAMLVRPSKWEAIYKASLDANEALTVVQKEHTAATGQHILIKELMAVAPTLNALQHANQVLAELAHVPLLAEDASSDRATAEAGLSDAQADAITNEAEVSSAHKKVESVHLDPEIVAVGQSVTQLHAGATAIAQLREHIATAEADVASRTKTLNNLAAKIERTATAQELVHRAPGATRKAEINGCIASLGEAERAIAQHRQSAPARPAEVQEDAPIIPDTGLQASVRVALLEVTKNDAVLKRLGQMPIEIRTAERAATASVASVGLLDESAARKVQPLLGAAIDHANQQLKDLGSKRADKTERVEEMEAATVQQQVIIDALLAHGYVPTHDDVYQARAHRQLGWTLIRGTYIDHTNPDSKSFTDGMELPEAYERSVAEADSVIDVVARDTGRVSSLEAARKQLADLNRDLGLRRNEIQVIDEQTTEFDRGWKQMLTKANIPLMPPAELRDWQARLEKTLSQLDELQAKRDELTQGQALERALADKLRQAIQRLGLTTVEDDAPLGTLVAIAEDAQAQIESLREARGTAAGQALEFQKQVTRHKSKDAELAEVVAKARVTFAGHLASILLGAEATVAMATARMAEFDELVAANTSVLEAEARRFTHAGAMSVYQETANNIAIALSEQPPTDISLAAERWASRLELDREQQRRLNLANQSLAQANKSLNDNRAKAARHNATLKRLCVAAGVAEASKLPEVEEGSNRKRQAMRDASAAEDVLAKASRRTVEELMGLVASRDHEALRSEESRLEQALSELTSRLESVRIKEEAARRELESLDSSDAAAAAADAMASAAATVRHTLPLQIRTRLAHALLQEAVHRFKEKSQAPMLKAASRYFVEITGSEFDGLFSDDSNATPVIAAKRPDGGAVSVEAMSEGTRDQLYLALRLAALELQRERGVHLPVILDDVLMTSDDVRAGCILKALEQFSSSSQVIVFTHHQHLIEVARRTVHPSALAVVELKRA